MRYQKQFKATACKTVELSQCCKDILAVLRMGKIRCAWYYVGASMATMVDLPDEEKLPGLPEWSDEFGPQFREGLYFNVNGKKGYVWRFAVAIDRGDDLFKVWLYSIRGEKIAKLDFADEVYIEDLPNFVETMYDNAIRVHNGGFINLC